MYLLLVPSLGEQFKARLVNGTAEAGRLEIFYDGTWNTVCDNGFGHNEALVACRMLGFNSTTAVAVGSAKYGAGSGPILFRHLQCVGNETSLAQCRYSELYRHDCEHRWDVGVACNFSEQLTARVVNGKAKAGRLEIFHDGTWNTVCGYGFGQEEALVACRMLGFNSLMSDSTTAVAVGSAKYGAGSGPILFDDLQCEGHETSLAQCKHRGLYRHYCGHWDDVGVACNISEQLTARVVNGTAEAGRLEIFYDGTWSTVCNSGFGQEEALVACRMLGFKSTTAAVVGSAKYGAGSGPILFSYLQCVGDETSLAQCRHLGLYVHNCGHSEDVGVACNFSEQLTARVVNGTAEAGRLEIFHDGTWNTVCGYIFGQEEALVACRMLGFNSTTAAAVESAKYGAGSGPILFSDVRCVGNETSLVQCEHSGLYVHYCKHWLDVGVACNITQELTARVVGGTTEAGRLEIFYDGTWNTVCRVGFGQEEALVACRMLGFNSTTAVAVGSAKYGAGSGPILFSDLRCVGNETSLVQCQHSGLYRHNCGHWQDVGVACNFTQELRARVVGGTAEAGRLEIFHDGTWNRVCDDGFGPEEALVACRMLGFNSTAAKAVHTGKYGAGSGPVLFDDLRCVGNETSLTQCLHSGLYIHDCGPWQDVGVMCNIISVWGEWGTWSACSATCGDGSRSRQRTCSPTQGACQGEATQADTCSNTACCVPQDGRWNNWGSWSSCSVSCGQGTRTRSRTCYGANACGRPCEGNSSTKKNCNLSACPSWGAWSSWTCSVTYGTGTMSRTRTCTPPSATCSGDASDQQECQHPACCDRPQMPFLLIDNQTTVNYTTNANNNVDFTCQVVADNVETLELLKVTKNVSQIVEGLSTSSPSFRIQKAGCADSGIYYCRAGNTLGQTNSTSVKLNVLCSPEWPSDTLATTTELKVTEGLEGQTTFEVMASPVPTIDGFVCHQEESNSSAQEKPVRSDLFTGKCEQKTPELHLATCTVYVTQATPTDTGLYSVHVSNSMGDMTVTFELRVTACRDNLTDCPSLASRCGEHFVQELCWKTCSGCPKQTSNQTSI